VLPDAFLCPESPKIDGGDLTGGTYSTSPGPV